MRGSSHKISGCIDAKLKKKIGHQVAFPSDMQENCVNLCNCKFDFSTRLCTLQSLLSSFSIKTSDSVGIVSTEIQSSYIFFSW